MAAAAHPASPVQAGDPEVVICLDEFGPLNLQPHPGRQWTTRAGGGLRPRRRRRATSTRPHGVRHLLAAYDLSRDKLYGHIKPGKRRGEFLVFLRYLRTLYPPGVRLGIVLDNFSPHLSTRADRRVADWAAANNLEVVRSLPATESHENTVSVVRFGMPTMPEMPQDPPWGRNTVSGEKMSWTSSRVYISQRSSDRISSPVVRSRVITPHGSMSPRTRRGNIAALLAGTGPPERRPTGNEAALSPQRSSSVRTGLSPPYGLARTV